MLRFNWKPSLVRLGLAAAADAGPCDVRTWAARSGVPRNHVLESAREGARLGLFAIECLPEGLRLVLQPAEFWRERELCERGEWAAAWGATGRSQARLGLVTEAPGLADALGERAVRNPERRPESGEPSGIRTSGIRSVEVESRIKCTREKGIEIPRGSRARVLEGTRSLSEPDRAYLLAKLARMPRVEQEILRPQDADQRRMGRLFWELEQSDPAWLRDRVGGLPDRHEIGNKAAWLNRAMSSRAAMMQAGRSEGAAEGVR